MLRIWTNFWQPSFTLTQQVRDETTGNSRKQSDQAQTPYRRLLAGGVLEEARQQALAETLGAYGPVGLRRALAAAIERLGRLQERPNGLFERQNERTKAG